MSPARTPLNADFKLTDRYRILRLIAEGGFGLVYAAEDRMLYRVVAVKEFFPAGLATRDGAGLIEPLAGEEDNFAKLRSDVLSEARTLARFHHPSLNTIHELMETNGTAYLVLSYEEGPNLKVWLDNLGRPPTQDELDGLLAALLDVLALLHGEGILHLDIAPDNIIMRASGAPVLVDLGASASGRQMREQADFSVMRPKYSPPEQYAAQHMDQGPWSDIYSLGAVLYRAVTGTPPPDAVERLKSDDLQWAPLVPPGIYRPDFLAAIDRALKLDVKDRPQTIAEWRSQLFAGREAAMKSAAAPSGRTSASVEEFARTPIPTPAARSAGNPEDTTRTAIRVPGAAADEPPTLVGVPSAPAGALAGATPAGIAGPSFARPGHALSTEQLLGWTRARSRTAAAPSSFPSGPTPATPAPAPAPMRAPADEPPTLIRPYPTASPPAEARAPARSGGGIGPFGYAAPIAVLGILAALFGGSFLAKAQDVMGHLIALLGLKLNAFSFFGLLKRQPAKGEAKADLVDCSVFAPPVAAPGAQIIVQVFLHLPQQAERATFLASVVDPTAALKGVKTLEAEIPRGARVTVSFSCKDLDVDEPEQTLVWRGEPTFAQFVVALPTNSHGRSFMPVVRISVDGTLLGRLVFRVSAEANVTERTAQPAGVSARRYQRAFVSYAAADRKRVLERVQMLQATRISFFQDVLSLDPGTRWQKELFKEIDQCDLFLLFWSSSAKDSEWVIKEALYALERQSRSTDELPDIVPVILEGPPPVVPPPSLNEIHFDDRLRYLIAAVGP